MSNSKPVIDPADLHGMLHSVTETDSDVNRLGKKVGIWGKWYEKIGAAGMFNIAAVLGSFTLLTFFVAMMIWDKKNQTDMQLRALVAMETAIAGSRDDHISVAATADSIRGIDQSMRQIAFSFDAIRDGLKESLRVATESKEVLNQIRLEQREVLKKMEAGVRTRPMGEE